MTIQKLKANRWCLYTSAKEQWRLVALLDGADAIQCKREFEHEDDYGAKSWKADMDHDIDTVSFDVARHLPKTVTEPWVTFEWRMWRAAIGSFKFPAGRSYDGRYGGVAVAESVLHPALGKIAVLHWDGQARLYKPNDKYSYTATTSALYLWLASLLNPGCLDELGAEIDSMEES